MTTPTGILFTDPQVKPLSALGQFQAGCSLVFYQTGTTTAANVYSDAVLATPLGNTVNADGNGRFVPIYMNPSVLYRVQLWSGSNGTGTKLEDADPINTFANAAAAGLYPQTAAEVAASVVPSNLAYPTGDLRRYGWVGDASTDDYNSFVAALSCNTTVTMPDPPGGFSRCSTGFTVPAGTTLRGTSMIPADQTGTPHGSVIKFDNGVATCVTFGAANNTSAGLNTIAIWRAGSPGAGSTGVFCDRINPINIYNVDVVNHAILYKFKAVGAAGIGANLINCYGSDCADKYFYVDSMPELRLTGGRYGRIGSGELAGNAFFYFTAQQVGATGPNTVCMENVNFNQGGVAGPTNFMLFDNITSSGLNEFQVLNCHIENITGPYIASTATAPLVGRLTIMDSVLNTNQNLFALNGATQLAQCRLTGNLLAGALTLAPTSLILNRIVITGNEIEGAVSITGPAGVNNNLVMTGNTLGSTLTLAGAWASLFCRGNVVSGSLTNSATQIAAGSPIVIDLVTGLVAYNNADDQRYSFNSANGPKADYLSARGFKGSETVSQASDNTGQTAGWLYDGSVYSRCAQWRFQNSGGNPGAGTTPGSVIFSTTPVGSASPTDVVRVTDAGNLVPITDNSVTCGASGLRWSAVWAANGSIQTSDARTKTNIVPVPLGLAFVNALRPVGYRFKVGGNKVVETAADGTPTKVEAVPGKRIHYGLIAQEVKAAADAAGVADFGGWVLTDATDPDSEQGLRYDQFVPVLIKAVQELSAEVAALKAAAPHA